MPIVQMPFVHQPVEKVMIRTFEIFLEHSGKKHSLQGYLAHETPRPPHPCGAGVLMEWECQRPRRRNSIWQACAALPSKSGLDGSPVFMAGRRERGLCRSQTQGQILSQSPADATRFCWHLYGTRPKKTSICTWVASRVGCKGTQGTWR